MPMANATAIAVRAASPEEIRRATRMPAARFALTPGALRRESRHSHWSHRLQDFSPPYNLWSNYLKSAVRAGYEATTLLHKFLDVCFFHPFLGASHAFFQVNCWLIT